MLSVAQARQELKAAARKNPGPWEQHSEAAAENAMRIAQKVPGMDPEKAYVMGLLHDIGRREGVSGMRHLMDGYRYLMKINQPELAVICLTHSYPVKNVDYYEGSHDCTPEDRAWIAAFLENREYDDYDRLIQLCDAISLPEGACLLEKRFVDVGLRHGVQAYTTSRWRGFLEQKKYFDTLCGCDIYTLLPDVWKNSMTAL